MKIRIFVVLAGLMLVFGGILTGLASGQTRGRKVVGKASHAGVKRPSREKLDFAEGADLERKTAGGRETDRRSSTGVNMAQKAAGAQTPTFGKARIDKLQRASKAFDGTLADLPNDPQEFVDRPDREGPNFKPLILPTGSSKQAGLTPSSIFAPAAPAPGPIMSFVGLGRTDVGNGYPPDTNGDVGPNNYIQTINTGIGIYDKNTGALQAGPFSFNTFMSLGAFGNICDTNNFGDPVVVYDTFEDRWIITDFAFTLDGSGNVTSPSFQCFAVSKTGDPVAGGWWYYFIQSSDALADYPKFGIWPDGLYQTANMFGKGSVSGSFVFSREWAFNKTQMYAGAPNPQIIMFEAPKLDGNGGTVFTIIPSNARLQAGTPPAGTPNYFVGTGSYTNALAVWKFHVDWTNVFNSTFTGVFTPAEGTTWISPPATVPSQAGNNLDTLATRSMVQNQYSNISGIESLWLTHTVRNSTTAGVAAARWYQLGVTGGTIAAGTTQTANHEPDTTVNRFMPSLAVDRLGDMLLGYSASNAAMKPAIRWAGRLAADTANTLPQTETDLIQGAGTQTNTCGGTCTRWGDYSAMTLDPVDGCTFWFTSEYYAADGGSYLTRIGSTKFPACSAVSPGTVSGTVTIAPGVVPIGGATVIFGGRTAITPANGTYSFANIPAGTYPSISASYPGKNTITTTNIVVPGGSTSTNNFALTAASTAGCLTDTTQTDFSVGTPTGIDLTTSAGDVKLLRTNVDQLNLATGGVGFGITATSWSGMTFTPAVTGQLTKLDVGLFCSNGLCTGTPTLTVSIRNISAGLPTGADLASGTITGFSSASSLFYTVNFASPATLTAGTQYAFIVRPVSNPSSGNYDFTVSGNGGTPQDVYAGGTRVSSTDSGGTWASTASRDSVFRTYMTTPSGTFVSGVKDANTAPLLTPTWSTFSWNATVPANTTLQFQVAGSNNVNGPFSFVGPDTTAGTFYSVSGGSLAQFNGRRYLKYKAFLTTTDPATTATLNDATLCFIQSPTAADVSVSGRVLTPDGRGIRNAVVVITDSRGIARSVTTSSFGNYRFDGLEAGQNYVVRVSSKLYRFAPRLLNLTDEVSDIDFIGEQ